MYTKLATVFLFYLIHIRLAVFYVIYILIVWVATQYPRYRGDRSGIVKVVSEEHFYLAIGALPGLVPENKGPIDKKGKKGDNNSAKDFSKI